MSVRNFYSGWYVGTLRQWHWISSALCLVGMLLFAITGITLNHAGSIPATPTRVEITAQLPGPLLAALRPPEQSKAALPDALRRWLASEQNILIAASTRGEWDDDELYVALPRPGGDAWLSLDLRSGELIYERTDRGWVAYFNDLHKGRDTGVAWRWFIDVFAVACVVFSFTGLLLLKRQAARRPTTWPVVALGLLIPLLLLILFVH